MAEPAFTPRAERLRDGTEVTLRAARRDDGARLAKAFAGLERESVYRRFFTYKPQLDDADLAALNDMDHMSDELLLVTVADAGDERVIGGARCIVVDAADDVRSAEVAFLVEEDYQGLGIARRLMGALVEHARACGIARFEADVLSGNQAMLNVFRHCGLPLRQHRDGGVVHVTLALDAGA